MSTFAKIVVLGRLGSNVCDHGKYVSFQVIADKPVRDSKGNWSEEPQGFYMKAMGQNASFLKTYIGVGDMVYIEAEPDFSKYTKKDGTTGYGTSFIVQYLKSIVKSSKAKRDKDGKYLPPDVIDKVGQSKSKKKTNETEDIEYDYAEEKDLLEEETGKKSIGEMEKFDIVDEQEENDEFDFDLDL